MDRLLIPQVCGKARRTRSEEYTRENFQLDCRTTSDAACERFGAATAWISVRSIKSNVFRYG
jgi:hypothetical protein